MFVFDGFPQSRSADIAEQLAGAPSAEELYSQRWPNTPQALEADQPDAGIRTRPWSEPAKSASAGSGAGATMHFSRCAFGSRASCVVDGDTIWLRGEKIRLADYNTPEVSSPGCAYEKALGERATARLLSLLNSGAVSVYRSGGNPDRDQYGRLLREVSVDGTSVGDTLIAEGLAHRWEGHRRNWC